MDRIFLRLAPLHFRRYQELVLRCAPLSPLCGADFFAAKIAGVVRHSSCPAAWREEARLGTRRAGGPCMPYDARQDEGHPRPMRVRLIGLCTWPSISFKPLPPEVSSEESVHRRTAAIYFPDFSSYGAPVPEEPRNSFRPSGSVTSRPFALFDPSLDR